MLVQQTVAAPRNRQHLVLLPRGSAGAVLCRGPARKKQDLISVSPAGDCPRMSHYASLYHTDQQPSTKRVTEYPLTAYPIAVSICSMNWQEVKLH